MATYNNLLVKKHINWVQSSGINNKKYNPWVGAQLLGVRDQFLIFHPLILLWDLKRIQLFLNRVQSYTNYSILLVDSRPIVQEAIEHYLVLNNIPKSVCHVLHFDFPGTLTNQYYLAAQSQASSLIMPRQIMVFFDYFLNKQFYAESLIVPSIRFSLYSLHNLPINMQYGLPSKSGLLLAIRLLLKLLLRSVVNTASVRTDHYRALITPFQKQLPSYLKQRTKWTSANFYGGKNNLQVNTFLARRTYKKLVPWRITKEYRVLKTRWSKVNTHLRTKTTSRKITSFKTYNKFLKKKMKFKVSALTCTHLMVFVKKQSVCQLFSTPQKIITKNLLASYFSNTFFSRRKLRRTSRKKKIKITRDCSKCKCREKKN